MQEKESIMVVRCELKILSLRITVRHHSASLVMPNSYPRDENSNPHLRTIKDSYNLNRPVVDNHSKAHEGHRYLASCSEESLC